jgi:NADH-quinone oxidoreductase subunit L
VSALIHAATMVTAGVYLLARMNPVVGQSDDGLWVIAVIGAATALFAALAAVAQQDIKRVLAYSTVSQLGYMFLAVGCGAYIAAVFHMVTHAFFKANLFLGSGSVIHGMHDEQDMRRMGGLAKVMPITAFTFIFGWLAIAGVPPFAGFWSKDDILLNAWAMSPALWVVGLVTAILTAYYMSRQVFLVFYGERRWDRALPGPDGTPVAPAHEVHPHESPWTMWVPLVVLAGLSIIGGLMNLPFARDLLVFEHFLEPVFEDTLRHVDVSTAMKIGLAVVSVIAALLGIAIAVRVWLQHRFPGERLEPEVLANAMYVDQTYARVAAGPGTEVFEATADFDKEVVDGAVNGVGTLLALAGAVGRRVQTGLVRQYAIGIALGAVALVIFLLTRAPT